MAIRPVLVLFLVSLLVATGCTVVHTVPLAARQGDTIMVSIGSPSDPTTNNITSLTYTKNGGSPIDIPISNILSMFNLYPDKKSFAWLYSAATLIENESGHGPWTTVFALTVPSNLPEGEGYLRINTIASNYPGTIPDPNGFNVALEILPGIGKPSSFDYLGIGQFVLDEPLSRLEPMKRLEFRPIYTGVDATNAYGAVEVKIAFNKGGLGDDYHIVWDEKISPQKIRNVHFVSNYDRFETTVYLISPTGELTYSDASFSIISMAMVDPANGYTLPTDADVVTTWYDINGNVVTSGPDVKVFNLTGI